MKNLAPHITRQRFLIEGFASIPVHKETIEEYFVYITNALSLRMYGEPIIFSPGGEGKIENQGYDAFVPLIDSGISLYYWAESSFVSVIVYTCKNFDESMCLQKTKDFFRMEETETLSF